MRYRGARLEGFRGKAAALLLGGPTETHQHHGDFALCHAFRLIPDAKIKNKNVNLSL